MYNGIGLHTPRGSGTNGYVTRNLSAIRKTKEKVPEYKGKEDSAVRPYDPELIDHERRRQAEVRCMELRELLEEENVPEAEIDEKVNAFRAKLLAEKKLSLAKDSSGRAMIKDSHELSMAQENKNERAKDAFGIRSDFIPGSSFEGKQQTEKPAASVASKDVAVEPPSADAKLKFKDDDRSRKRKKQKKGSSRRSSSSSSGSSSSSDEEEKRKKRKKEKDRKKKSKKSRHSRGEDEGSKDGRSSSSSASCSDEESHKSPNDDDHIHEGESDDGDEIVAKYSVAIVDIPNHGELSANTIDITRTPTSRSHSHSPVGIIESTLIPVLQNNSSLICPGGKIHTRKSRNRSPSSPKSSRSGTPVESTSRSRSRSEQRSHKSKSKSRSPSAYASSRSRSTTRSRSGSSRSRSKSWSRSPKSRSRSRSNSSSASHSSASSRSSARSIPRRRGSPSFLDRRRITSARKRPIPYKPRNGFEWDVSSSSSDSS